MSLGSTNNFNMVFYLVFGLQLASYCVHIFDIEVP